MANVVSIREAARRAKEDELGIGEYTIRLWVKSGKLPVRFSGRKALIYYPGLVDFLRGGDNVRHQDGAE